jgi:zinc/manganese transport system substrate-binding protein/zinc transport system substrate-binding protein
VESADGGSYYWLDPVNGKTIAKNILAELIRVDPKGEPYFTKNYRTFCRRLDSGMLRWTEELAPYRGAKIAALDGDWSYFAGRFQLVFVGDARTQPDAKLVLAATSKLKRMSPMPGETEGRLVVAPISVGEVKGAGDYFTLCEHLVHIVAEKLK